MRLFNFLSLGLSYLLAIQPILATERGIEEIIAQTCPQRTQELIDNEGTRFLEYHISGKENSCAFRAFGKTRAKR